MEGTGGDQRIRYLSAAQTKVARRHRIRGIAHVRDVIRLRGSQDIRRRGMRGNPVDFARCNRSIRYLGPAQTKVARRHRIRGIAHVRVVIRLRRAQHIRCRGVRRDAVEFAGGDHRIRHLSAAQTEVARRHRIRGIAYVEIVIRLCASQRVRRQGEQSEPVEFAGFQIRCG